MAYNPVSDVPFSDVSTPVDTLLVSDIPKTFREMKTRINEVAAGIYSSLVGVGTIVIWSNSAIPANYLECNGQASQGALTALRSTTPDYRGQFLRGWAHGSQDTPDLDGASRILGSVQQWTVGKHGHALGGNTGNVAYDDVPTWEQTMNGDFSYRSENERGDVFIQDTGVADNRPTNISVMFIIRYQ